MPKYLVETISQHRVVLVIEAENQEYAEDEFHMNNNMEEFGQTFLGQMVVSSREIDDAECIRVHDELNGYLSEWTDEMKLARIHKATKNES